MKWINFLIYVASIIVILIAGASIHNKYQDFNLTPSSILNTNIEKEKLIDKKIVIDKLSEKLQVVGLEGEITKDFDYLDNKWYGEKYFKMTLYAKFKFGFNVNELKEEDIIVNGTDIIINMPNAILISLEVPYNKIAIEKGEGLFRKDFTEEEKQLLYESAYESIYSQILNDNALIQNAEKDNEIAIRSILMLIPEIETISFR